MQAGHAGEPERQAIRVSSVPSSARCLAGKRIAVMLGSMLIAAKKPDGAKRPLKNLRFFLRSLV
ncbi:hypothetical protein B2K_09945 [Paenibacillus mucilaginosus K02]|uniref:Uncharacterized protein n=1 Tax=Paenibacillus mucilaginosus K02 TaxID=997761 RepID=I0BF92_9BACL|nr:hypothetical protein B2K_09945 [Paenibacillus mucilaginosus K02]